MTTQIVYVVVSDETDTYLEQIMVSVYSLRMHTPAAKVVLVTDRQTDLTLSGRRAGISDYISEKRVVEVPDGYSKTQRSRYLKTTVRQNVPGDFLFVDSDTVILRDLTDADSLKTDIGAVRDLHLPYSRNPGRGRFDNYLRMLGLNPAKMNDRYFNSGMLFVRDTPLSHRLYREWHRTWTEGVGMGINFDQPALAKADRVCGNVIRELPGTWNCQITTPYGRSYHDDAYILHYFGAKNSVPSLTGVPPELNELIAYASDSFLPKISIPMTDTEAELLRSKVAVVFQNHKRVFGIFERISALWMKFKKEPLN